MGKHITIVLHQVLLDLSMIAGHIGMQKNNGKLRIFNVLLGIYYRFLTYPAHNIVVLEDVLKERLQRIVSKPITVIPHGVDPSLGLGTISKANARKQLGIDPKAFVVLQAGYVTWYKGVDWLAQQFSKQLTANSSMQLIIAGGASFTQGQKPHYKAYYDRVVGLAKHPNIRLTGFVKEKDFALYFSACDVVVFPYRTFMSSSGPLATTLAFGKPFVVSEALAGLLKTQDIQESLRSVGLQANDVVFGLNTASFGRKLQLLKKPNMLKKLTVLSEQIRQKRAFTTLAPSYNHILFESSAAGSRTVPFVASRAAPLTQRIFSQ